MSSNDSVRSVQSIRIEVFGRVQGIGARPAVARLAEQLALAGSVRNTLAGLAIDVEGRPEAISEFRRRLPAVFPESSVIHRTEVRSAPFTGVSQFSIGRDDTNGLLTTPVPRDVAVCDQCLSEASDPTNRRFEYPLTSCATCGPRYTIIESMPFERAQTSMVRFPLCPACRREYDSSRDRRFHAQTTCCRECGPQVWWVDRDGHAAGEGATAVETAALQLHAGNILALRGVGGYQLLCDATNEDAVRRLRHRKRRPAKPLAVLVASLSQAEQYALCDEQERAALQSPANPIVLVRARSSTNLSASVHPDLDTVGLMLPTTPLHAMLCRQSGRPLVCTSANREGDPVEYEIRSAERNLAGIADGWLHHDRPIVRPIDDSVVRVIAGRAVTIRLARGLAPLPLDLPTMDPQLALGGHLKSAIAWSNGSQAALGPHVGDLDTVSARQRWQEVADAVASLYRFSPHRVLHDLHPDYYPSQVAGGFAGAQRAVQHHVAHVAAGLLEHQLLDRQAIGVAWDGTGYGLDGTIWGSEFFVVDGQRRYRRFGHLRSFPLLGGESAVREPWRVAAAVLDQAIGRDAWLRARSAVWPGQRIEVLLPLLDRRNRESSVAPVTTSAGRLFDAFAAIILGMADQSYEGQAAMRLEAVADRRAEGSYPFPVLNGESSQLDWRPLVSAVWDDYRRGASPGEMSARLHRSIANGICAMARRFPGLPVVVGGGVFQNRLLCEYLVEQIDDPQRLRLPGLIPPNDGGLAAGQLALASRL